MAPGEGGSDWGKPGARHPVKLKLVWLPQDVGTCREIGPGGRGGDRGGFLAVRDSHHVVGFGLVGFGGGGGGREVGVRAVEAPENERERERGGSGSEREKREADESEEEEGDSLRRRRRLMHGRGGGEEASRRGKRHPPHGKGDSC